MSKVYLKSATAGKTWSIGFLKQPKKPACWVAIEGELEKDEFGSCFKFTLFQAKSKKQVIEGAATAKKKDAALAALIQSLKAEGLAIEEAA